jgi:hypothetical protein
MHNRHFWRIILFSSLFSFSLLRCVTLSYCILSVCLLPFCDYTVLWASHEAAIGRAVVGGLAEGARQLQGSCYRWQHNSPDTASHLCHFSSQTFVPFTNRSLLLWLYVQLFLASSQYPMFTVNSHLRLANIHTILIRGRILGPNKVLRVFLLAIHSHLYQQIYSSTKVV